MTTNVKGASSPVQCCNRMIGVHKQCVVLFLGCEQCSCNIVYFTNIEDTEQHPGKGSSLIGTTQTTNIIVFNDLSDE